MKIPKTCGSTRVDEEKFYFDALFESNEEQNKNDKSNDREEPTDGRA